MECTAPRQVWARDGEVPQGLASSAESRAGAHARTPVLVLGPDLTGI